MRVVCKGPALIKKGAAGRIYEINQNELDWNSVGGGERQMGYETHHQAVLEHPKLGTLTWSIWEYPDGVENFRETNVGKNKLVKDFEYGLEHEDPGPDDWSVYPIPEKPFRIFIDSWQQTGNLLNAHTNDPNAYLLNRMVFSHQITPMEAYLGDTLINEVLRDNDAIARLIKKDTELAQKKFTLTEISGGEDLVRKNVRDHLRSILYHNLAKVDALYKIALQINILPHDDGAKNSLFRAVQLRHDCVHRNGFDKDGKPVGVFTRSFVEELANLIKGFIENVEKEVQARSSSTLSAKLGIPHPMQ